MEKFPENFNQESNETQSQDSKRKGKIAKAFGKAIAIGSVAGLSIFGGEKVEAADTNQQDHVKGSSLGKYYENKFKHQDQEKQAYLKVIERAKEILKAEGHSVTDESDITVTLEFGVLTGIKIDGESIKVDDKYHTPEELDLLKAKDSTKEESNKEDKETGNKGIPNKTVISDDAKDFF